MRSLLDRTAKSARAKVAVALLGALGIAGVSAIAIGAAGGRPDYAVAVSPAAQTIDKGRAATYSVSVSRAGGFSDPVSLEVAGLPAGATARWRLADGTASHVVPATVGGAVLTVETTSSTPAATSQLTIRATAGRLARATVATLTVEPAAQPGFSLTASPVTRTVLHDDETTYAVAVQRTGGFAGPVALGVTGLPRGTTARWSTGPTLAGASATLTVAADRSARAGAHELTITGAGDGGAIQRAAGVTLVVERGQSFSVTGDLAAPLGPGVEAPLDLALTNPNAFPIRVHGLTVSVEEQTSRPGCSGTRDFAATVPAAAFPLEVPARTTATLSRLGVAAEARPRVAMVARDGNQDACKGATIQLRYGGTAGR